MNKDMTIEAAVQRIDEAVEKLENTPMLINESVETYVEAAELLAFCYQELETAKGKIRDVDRMIAEKKAPSQDEQPQTDEINRMVEDDDE